MADVVEIDDVEETASGAEEVGGGGDAEVAGSKHDITDTRLIGLRILLGFP
jgi:hypothetical protein